MATEFSNAAFKYGGKKYGFMAYLNSWITQEKSSSSAGSMESSSSSSSSGSNDETKFINLDPSRILSFEYVNSINLLYVTGELVYIDPVGKVANSLNDLYLGMSVMYGELEDQEAGDIKKFKLSENSVSLSFIVSNVQILSRSSQEIRYKFHLVSRNYYLLAANINYSNYDKDPEPISEIIKACLMTNANEQVSVDSDTFDLYKEDQLKLNYMTSGNDDAIATTKYLLDKQFMYSDKIENIKFLYYDEITNSYKFLQIKEIENNPHLSKDLKKNISEILISMFNTKEEDTTYVLNNQLATVVSFPKTKLFKSTFSKLITTYDFNLNALSTNDIPAKAIFDLVKESTTVDYGEKKYKDMPVEELKLNQFNLSSEGSYWNNDYSIYSDMCHELVDDNALIVNTDGSVLRTVGGMVQIVVPYSKIELEDKEGQKETEIAERYNQLRGEWIIGKVRHIVKPASNEYRQNLILFKNYKQKKADLNSLVKTAW